jgi:hypothetical protein
MELDLEAIKARRRDDINALIARVEELEAAIREHCEACALSIECGRCSLDSPAYCAIRPYRGGE